MSTFKHKPLSGKLRRIQQETTRIINKVRPAKKKIIIAGTGRAGTSFLVVLLTRLGFNTGYAAYIEDYSDDLRAGCEYDLFHLDPKKQKQSYKQAPYILKHPEYSLQLESLLKNKLLEVEHVIIPVRDISQVARSRRNTNLVWTIEGINDMASNLETDQIALTYALGKLVETCTLYNLPFTILKFPDLVTDAHYCYQSLSKVFKINKDRFNKIFRQLSKPESIQTK